VAWRVLAWLGGCCHGLMGADVAWWALPWLGGCRRGGVLSGNPQLRCACPGATSAARRLAECWRQSDGDAICSPRRSLCLCFSKMCFLFRGLSQSFCGGAREERNHWNSSALRAAGAVRSFGRGGRAGAVRAGWALCRGAVSSGAAGSAGRKEKREGWIGDWRSEGMNCARWVVWGSPFRIIRIKLSLIKLLSASEGRRLCAVCCP